MPFIFVRNFENKIKNNQNRKLQLLFFFFFHQHHTKQENHFFYWHILEWKILLWTICKLKNNKFVFILYLFFGTCVPAYITLSLSFKKKENFKQWFLVVICQQKRYITWISWLLSKPSYFRCDRTYGILSLIVVFHKFCSFFLFFFVMPLLVLILFGMSIFIYIWSAFIFFFHS